MMRRTPILLFAVATSLVWSADYVGNVPVENFRMPWFDDEAGRITAEVRGASGRVLPDQTMEITRLNLRMFGEGGPEDVAMAITSPLALVDPDSHVAAGPGQLRVTTPEFEIYGDGWSYNHETKTATINNNVVATFSRDLGNILP